MHRQDASKLILSALAVVGIYFLMAYTLHLDTIIILLNGLFSGAMAAIVVAYGRLIWFAVIGKEPYDSIRQMTLGFFLSWAAISIGVANSVYIRAIDASFPVTHFTGVARYTAIVAAVLQVTAPDFGLGFFHGRDRKVLWASCSIGATVAIVVMFLQAGHL